MRGAYGLANKKDSFESYQATAMIYNELPSGRRLNDFNSLQSPQNKAADETSRQSMNIASVNLSVEDVDQKQPVVPEEPKESTVSVKDAHLPDY